jgi:hypothetical protein
MRKPSMAISYSRTAVLCLTLFVGGCTRHDSYQILSAKEDQRNGAEDHIVTVFTIKHDRTVITASCPHVSDTTNRCSELQVGENYPLERHRSGTHDVIVFRDRDKKAVAVLFVEAENVQP